VTIRCHRKESGEIKSIAYVLVLAKYFLNKFPIRFQELGSGCRERPANSFSYHGHHLDMGEKCLSDCKSGCCFGCKCVTVTRQQATESLIPLKASPTLLPVPNCGGSPVLRTREKNL